MIKVLPSQLSTLVSNCGALRTVSIKSSSHFSTFTISNTLSCFTCCAVHSSGAPDDRVMCPLNHTDASADVSASQGRIRTVLLSLLKKLVVFELQRTPGIMWQSGCATAGYQLIYYSCCTSTLPHDVTFFSRNVS